MSARQPNERQPPVTSPVSQSLPVADLARSLKFYCDVLGFQRNGAENQIVCGPAQLSLQTTTSDAVKHRTVFFETGNVERLRESVVAHGGRPGDIQRINWIKLRMFELRDPDGHSLWFGRSFHNEPASDLDQSLAGLHTPPGKGQLRQALPCLPLGDVAAGIAYYRDVLGFHINYSQADLGVMDRDSITLLLTARRDGQGSGSCYFYIRDADALHAELLSKGANVQGAPVSHPWGLRDFSVLDLEGNELRFGQTFE